ncbi:Gti1/Pac2 family-domain-containing protein, partial [Fomitopsis serialis]|uniref:Gti1/Pac2 family-domain-containing protein n=1 Tax=Fomitopsis serialis TaxID=139415 RepID=UPI002007ED6D
QMPTYVGARVRATEEAHLVLHAVALNRLPMIHNRLLNVERWSIMEGSIFVWEERVGSRDDSTSSAICRWTDGRRWGPSRVKDEFLIYHENLPALPDGTPQADKDDIASRLIKQTYSAWVQVNGQRKKWHLVAYYTQKTDKTLTRIFDIPDFAALRGTFSPDKYTSARAPKTRGRSNS